MQAQPLTVTVPESDSYGAAVSTRVKLLLAGEHLFGEFGIEAAPLRLISKEAGQRNTNAVQYHFRNRLGLLRAIFDYREAQLDPFRKALLARTRESDSPAILRDLLRVCFEPNYRHYSESRGISYIKLHAQYLSTHRPRGVLHPVDEHTPSTAGLREGMRRLHERLNFLDDHEFMLRLESVGTMFLGAVIQNDVRPAKKKLAPERLFEDLLDMMAAAISARARLMNASA
jgi:AcrR family transcriptional regulator